MSNKRFGYARTSTTKQDNGLETQIESLKKAKCDKIYSEQISGKSKNRPELNKMLDNLPLDEDPDPVARGVIAF